MASIALTQATWEAAAGAGKRDALTPALAAIDASPLKTDGFRPSESEGGIGCKPG
jgi:hypothetical protein